VQAEFAEQFVDAFVGFGLHLGRWRPVRWAGWVTAFLR
jgi:hypothetical protein